MPEPPSEHLTIDGPAGAIEALLERPGNEVPLQPVVAVFCHPLPIEGGTMHNKVVTMGCRALRELGVTTVRFNFRGVGGSAGTFDNGNGEAGDLGAVVAWVRAHYPAHALWLAGFSFGAYVSLKCAAALEAALVVSVAPPAGRRWDFDAVPAYAGPWIVIQGEADEIVEPQAVYDWLERMAATRAAPELVRIPEASHFFHGKLIDLRGALRTAARVHLPAAHG